MCEREVWRPERISVDRQIARLLDDQDATEQLLRGLVYRWRHSGGPDDEFRQRVTPTLLELWQAFHSASDSGAVQDLPMRVPTAAAEQRAAVTRVLSSPRSIATVLSHVGDKLAAGQLRGGADEPVLNAVAYLARKAFRR
ncbi:hypothetical protein AB0C34_16885 [Nocardia sp. NPDC049220]|uniref:hypothetical protein n=1 Tax=Nocardia sp. NPDC049220 TaxID=3155273 RepID=UPI0033E2C934